MMAQQYNVIGLGENRMVDYILDEMREAQVMLENNQMMPDHVAVSYELMLQLKSQLDMKSYSRHNEITPFTSFNGVRIIIDNRLEPHAFEYRDINSKPMILVCNG